MNKFLKIFLIALVVGCVPMAWACDDDDPEHFLSSDFKSSDRTEKVTEKIEETTLVDPSKAKGVADLSYLNNEDSVVENRNKMRLNTASQAIALGQHAVALAVDAEEKDIEPLRKEIEYRDDMLRMLKGIAKLQAQHLQKINAITAMRAKMVELTAMNNIISGDIYTTKKAK